MTFNGHFEAGKMPPFQEAVDWFLAKNPMTRAEFARLSAAARTKAFTVAYVITADSLQSIFGAIGEILEKGGSYQEFKALTENILKSPWHRETVFRTNVLSSYGAGHWQQAQAVKDLRPYVIYRDCGDGRVRAWHRLGGLVMRQDDPFVRSHWGPWEWNCRCRWLSLSGREVEEKGYKITTDAKGLPPANPKFSSPAMGGWEPDYSKYAPELGAALKQKVERAIYD